VTRAYVDNKFGAERGELFISLMQEIQSSGAVRHLLSEAAQEAYAQGLGPVDVLALGMNYGMALGVLMERERAGRQRRMIT